MSAAPGGGLARFGALWACYFAAIGAFNPYSPLWFKELGFSTLAIGTLVALQSWTRVLAPYGWGWLGDHLHGGAGRVRLIRWAAGLSLGVACALLWTRSYTAVAIAVTLLFLANAGVVPLSEAVLARHLQARGQLDSARYGRVRLWGSVGFILAVTVYGFALEALSLAWFPVLVLGLYLALWTATLRLPATPEESSRSGTAPPVWPVLRQPEVAWFFASAFFTVLAHVALYAFFSLYLDAMGHDKRTVGLLWAVSVAVEIVFFWRQGPLFDRLDVHRWLAVAAAVTALRFVVIAAFGGSLALLVVAQALHAITFAAHHSACILMVNRHFPGALRGRGQALYTMLGYGVSGVIGGVGGGWLSARFGFEAVFWAASVAAALGVACALASRRAVADGSSRVEVGR
jgi:MFS transporter, PPP family, 3-phenylpropionic acid transporter